MPVAALDNWQPVWNAQVSISTPVCVNFELRPGAGYIHICWFNFDALAQGNAYKPTKEPINYRGPGGDRTHDFQTEATPPAASCPARTLHATEFAPKNATPMTCPWLHWTTDNPSGMHRCQFQHLCVLILNCAYIHTYIHTYIHIHTYIFIRGFALAQGTFLLVIFAWICYDGFENKLRNGYLLKCDCLSDCNWHIGTKQMRNKD